MRLVPIGAPGCPFQEWYDSGHGVQWPRGQAARAKIDKQERQILIGKPRILTGDSI